MNEMIDPKWAWEPFKPSSKTPWDLRAASHLFRRAGFGASRQELESAVKQDPQDLVQELLAAREPESFQGEMNSLIRAGLASGNIRSLSAQWAYRMLRTPAQLREKMTLFWHGHFATSGSKVEDAKLMQQQNDLLRKHALGDFGKLALEISKDPAMLIYLDSASNRKAHPNENYAREIMELFCLGEGNYTEADIRELARCFTGWEIKRNKFRFNRYQNDRGEKSVLGTTGNLSGEDGVRIVVQRGSAPVFLVRKLIRFFVMDEPTAPDELIQPLAEKMRDDGMQIAPTVGRILSSNLFFSAHSRGRKLRSPVEVAIGFLRCLEGSTDAYQLSTAMEKLGQGLYFPPSVKGWDGGRTWINSSTLLGRANLIREVLSGGKSRFAKQSISDFMAKQKVFGIRNLINWLDTSLFAVRIPGSTHERIVKIDRDAGGDAETRLKDAIHLVCSLPEFQLA